jgi:hypothetical protein
MVGVLLRQLVKQAQLVQFRHFWRLVQTSMQEETVHCGFVRQQAAHSTVL